VTAVIIASSTTAASSSRPPVRFGTGFVHGQWPPATVFAIERRYGSVRFTVVGHFHKRKPSRPASVAIGDDGDSLNCTERLKQFTQIRFSHTERKVANEDLLHGFPL
jgi:hypothetical protein